MTQSNSIIKTCLLYKTIINSNVKITQTHYSINNGVGDFIFKSEDIKEYENGGFYKLYEEIYDSYIKNTKTIKLSNDKNCKAKIVNRNQHQCIYEKSDNSTFCEYHLIMKHYEHDFYKEANSENILIIGLFSFKYFHQVDENHFHFHVKSYLSNDSIKLSKQFGKFIFDCGIIYDKYNKFILDDLIEDFELYSYKKHIKKMKYKSNFQRKLNPIKSEISNLHNGNIGILFTHSKNSYVPLKFIDSYTEKPESKELEIMADEILPYLEVYVSEKIQKDSRNLSFEEFYYIISKELYSTLEKPQPLIEYYFYDLLYEELTEYNNFIKYIKEYIKLN